MLDFVDAVDSLPLLCAGVFTVFLHMATVSLLLSVIFLPGETSEQMLDLVTVEDEGKMINNI